MSQDDPPRGNIRLYRPGTIHTPFDFWAASVLWWVTAVISSCPSRGPQRVDGEAATREYERENGLARNGKW